MNSSPFRRAGLAAIVGVASFGFATASSAVVMFDQNVTPDVIFGTGNDNGAFTVDTNNNVELGLRGKLRHNAVGDPENTFNSNANGTYSFAAGVAPTQAFPTAVWSFEWSINTNADGLGSNNLADLTFELGLDLEPSLGTNFIGFDPIHASNPNFGEVRWDHALGTNATGNGGGSNAVASEAVYAAALGANNVAQNSWKAHWFFGAGFDPTLDATYDLYLSAFENGNEVARTDIQIIVGRGGAPAVPEPATLALFGAGVLGMLGARRRKRS